MKSNSSLRLAAVLGAAGMLVAAARAQDSPQFRGADRTGIVRQSGLLKSWPEGGPKLLWSAKGAGEGHATPSVARGRIYGMGLRGNDEVVWALDEKTGKEIWSTKIDSGIVLEAQQGGNGPRSTPTIDGNRLYAIGVAGKLVCLNLANGKMVWKASLVDDFGGKVPTWGYSESPLVEGNRVIATPGGETTLVAFNKNTGAVAWKSSVGAGNGVAYSSAIGATYGGKRHVIQFLAGTLVGVDAVNGKLLWRFDAPATPRGINCSSPIFKDGYVFAAASYQHGGALGKLSATGGAFSAEQVYFTKDMRNHHGGMVVIGDHLYGFDESNLTCIEFATGKVKWQNRSVGKGSIVAADGMLICRSERGPVALVEANPNEYVEKGRFEQPERSQAPSWPYPVVANGRLYLRDQDVLLCYEIAPKGAR